MDIDFSQERRTEVLEIARDLYGHDQTTQIGAFQRYGYKSVIQQIGHIAGLMHNEIDELRSLIPDNILGGRKIMRELAYCYEELPKVREWLDARPVIKRALLAADGGYQHMGRHAAGVLVMEAESRSLIPLASPDGVEMVTGWDMYDIERLNLLKMDFLGLRTLDIIEDACRWLGIKPSDIDHDVMDAKTKQCFDEGHTLGIFQVEGWGYTKLCKQLKPTSFHHIAALNALYRPGCLEAYLWVKDGKVVHTDDPALDPPEGVERINMVEVYVRRLNEELELEFAHEDLEPILGFTQGIILYQEQAMRIATDLAGFTGSEADKLRKAIGKKRKHEMDAIQPKFVNQLLANGYSRQLASILWENIAAAARYSWNLSHATAYGFLTFRCAWLKMNEPTAWYAALMKSYIKKEHIANAISEMRMRKIPLVPVDINASGKSFDLDLDRDAVRFGFDGIHGLGGTASNNIFEERKQGPFLSLLDFVTRCSSVPISVTESLIAAGAFDNCTEETNTRPWLLHNARTVKANTKLKIKQHPYSEEIPTKTEMLEKEREVLGFFVSEDPLEDVRDSIAHMSQDNIMIGTVSHIRTKDDRKGNAMAFLTIDDPEAGRRSATLFASIWQNCVDQIKTGRLIVLEGEDEVWNGRTSFKVDRMLHVI